MRASLRSTLVTLLATALLVPAASRGEPGAGGTIAPTTPGAPTQPSRPEPPSPATQPAVAAAPSTQPWIGIGSTTIPIELPTLSGRLFDQFGYTFHGQATIYPQFHGDFPADYAGPNSFRNTKEIETSYTGTLFTGIRLFKGTEVYVDPEVSAGSGLGGVTGIGNPPNGETPRVSTPEPSPYVARLYLRQTIPLGGSETEDVPDGPNQVAGTVPVNRLTVTLGKFAVNDLFDNNTYAHDPRAQFSNWGFMDNGAFDYSADTKGYTQGLALELNTKSTTLRYAIFREPRAANGGRLDDHWDRAFAQAWELEQRYTVFGHAGAVRPLAYLNFARMGDYRDAITSAPPGTVPNVLATRSYSHPKYGFGLNAEQAITDDLGLFARLGWNNGQSETFTYTEVDRTASVGISCKGTHWHRPDDVVALGGIIGGLSKDHRDYLAAGGLGFELGDGRLRYAPEEVIEAYYLVGITKNFFATFDYQFINHPGYNADRGPVSIGGARIHFEF